MLGDGVMPVLLVLGCSFWEKKICLRTAAFDIFFGFVLSIFAPTSPVPAGDSSFAFDVDEDGVTTSNDDFVMGAEFVWIPGCSQSLVPASDEPAIDERFSLDSSWSSTSGILFDTLVPDSMERFRCVFVLRNGSRFANVDRL